MDSKKNLYSPKCLCGVPVVRACSVFAVVNLVLVLLLILGSLVSVAFVTSRYAAGYIEQSHKLFELVAGILIAVAFYVGTIISAIFATLLLIGIRKKKPKFVKAYLVYGVVMEISLILSTFVYIGFNSQAPYNHASVAVFAICGITAICVCILYGYIVQLVYITYIVLKNSRSNFSDVQTLCLAETESSLPTMPT